MTQARGIFFPVFLLCSSQVSLKVVAFSTSFGGIRSSSSTISSTKTNDDSVTTKKTPDQAYGNILILDHLNINHEKGRHDLLKAFYFDFLGCAVDPRKEKNFHAGKKTVWANIGAQQFHLPEGKPEAQVFQGLISLTFPDLESLKTRYHDTEILQVLKGTQFCMTERDGVLLVTDPWGSRFRIVAPENSMDELDPIGTQKGRKSEGIAMRDLTVYAPHGSNFAGIARFYEQILGSPIISSDQDAGCKISVGPKQTLTFAPPPQEEGIRKDKISISSHVDLVDEEKVDGRPHFFSNYGPHVSMYVADLCATYERAKNLNLAYVNPRFKRRAYDLEGAIDECMFRCLDIVDPDDVKAGPILQLEHEIRSVVKRDGTKYKSCPFDDIPTECVK